MPKMPIPPEGEINYVIDNYAWPWETPESILCVHGVAECTRAWTRWVPTLAQRGRVIRMDQRGFGESTPMTEDYAWNLDVMADDVARLIETVAPEGLHLVGAKIAGPVVSRAATRHPGLIKTLTLVGTPIVGPTEHEWLATVEQEGVRAWAEKTMDARLAGMSDAAKAWWIGMMADTPQSTLVGFFRFVSSINVQDDLGKISCPTLVIGSDNARRPIKYTRDWQQQIPGSKLALVPGEGYHAATTQALECAALTADFIAHHQDK
ncbi:MAG: alpha/beta hydrolase [Proteobacteria bacterium]|nr:alpha/beta hydrolase [Pseudomonadota bacterium]